MKAELPSNEDARVRALRAHNILDTPAERSYDDIVQLAALICGTPIALMTLLEGNRQWFKSKVGLAGSETPRDVSFCAHAILDPTNVLVVPDATKDERFSNNPYVTGDPNVRFYAGTPLVDLEGHALGALCVIDHIPRVMKAEQLEALRILGRHLIVQMELTDNLQKLARFQKMSIGREHDMIRMKSEINDLLRAAGQLPRYPIGLKGA